MSKPTPLAPDTIYHIYNRGNNAENIFIEERNYRHFLQLYRKHLAPIADTFAYCLLRNHFHWLVRIKQPPNQNKKPSQHFANFFNAYAKAFNNLYSRSGALFERPFNRIAVRSDAHLRQLIAYIHQNPQKHGFVDDFRDWPYSSYHALLDSRRDDLMREEVLDWFQGEKGYRDFHAEPVWGEDVSTLAPEDFD